MTKTTAEASATVKPKRLRIAQVHWAFPPTIGGVETHLSILMPELVRNGHRVSLLTSQIPGAPRRCEFGGAEILRTPYLSLSYLMQHDAELLEDEIRRAFREHFEAFRPDLVHAHNLHYFTLVHGRILSDLCRSRGIPLILTSHNAWNDTLFLHGSRDIPWDHIIAVSHYIKREMCGVGCDPRRLTVIHHGIDIDAFHPDVDSRPALQRFPQLQGRRVLFHPARMGMAKGNDVVVKAFRRVREQYHDAVLVFAGSENIVDWEQKQRADVNYILDLVKFFGLKKSVLIDVFSLEEMPLLYAASQVAVYPSTVPEPFGLTLLEAMASARPMIVSNAGGMPEVIQDGISGYVVPMRDHESLAARVLQLFGDAQLRERIGHTARAIVGDHFSKELMVRNHESVYYRALARTREAAKVVARIRSIARPRGLRRRPALPPSELPDAQPADAA